MTPSERLRHHVSGKIARGEAEAVTAVEMPDLIAGVREYALQHYNAGWDVIVEATEDAELAADIGTATSVRQAIASVAERRVSSWAESSLNSRWGEDSDPELQVSPRVRR